MNGVPNKGRRVESHGLWHFQEVVCRKGGRVLVEEKRHGSLNLAIKRELIAGGKIN